MVTLKDIAKEAGVSVMTVSRVVNGHFSKVSEENVRRIQKIIQDRHYIPNSTARSLSSRSSHIIALILRGRGNQLSNPYNAAMVGEIIPIVQQHGYYLMVHCVNHYDDITQRLHAWNAEGAIFIGTFDRDIQQILFDNRIPLVFTDSYSQVRQITNVGLDDYKGGVLAAQYFLRHNHRSFAYYCWPLASSVVSNRLKGFRNTLEAAGFTLEPSHVIETEVGIPTEDAARKICSLKDRPTAIFTSADMLGFALINELKRMGYEIPKDFSVIGFDDLAIGRFFSPPLTTIRQDTVRKAQIATDLLFQHIQDPTAPAQNITLDVQVVERQSVCDMPPFQKAKGVEANE